MDEAFIARLVALVERAGIAELELSQDGARLRIVKSPGETAAFAGKVGEAAPQAAEARPSRYIVRAGFPGTFFRAPAPGRKPFVAVGDHVAEGRQLAILEAMKTMNPLECDRAGRMAEILAEDGAAVEAGDPLFALDPE